jgi:predicted outer membrane repeat protein
MSARQRRKRMQRRKEAARTTSARSRRVLAGAGLTLGVGLGLSSSAQGAVQTFTVGSTADTATASDCATLTNTDCTLRDAILASNADANPSDQDVIVFAAAITGSASTITLTANPPTINQSLWIQGPGTDPGDSNVTVDGDDSYRDIFAKTGGNYAMNLKVSGLTLTNGAANGGGAGISIYYDYGPPGHTSYPQPTLTVENSEVSGNTGNDGAGIHGVRASIDIENSIVSDNTAHGVSSGAGGAGVYLFPGLGGTLTIDHSTIADNTANGNNGRGGGVHSTAPTTIQSSTISGNHTTGAHATGGGLELNASSTIENSTISDNYTEGQYARGGGVSAGASNNLTVDNSTIYGNSTQGTDASGGGLASNASAGPTITDSTIFNNYSYVNGGGIYAKDDSPPMTLDNTIVSGNRLNGLGPDLYSPNETFQASFSLIGDPSDATINATVAGSNLMGVDPLLGQLQDNGGPTFTDALPANSPAVDAGSSASLLDQRGLLRTVAQGVARSTAAGANCADIGAFELQVSGGGPGATCHPSPPPATPTPPASTPTPAPTKKCKKKKHKRSAQVAKKKCKKKKKG